MMSILYVKIWRAELFHVACSDIDSARYGYFQTPLTWVAVLPIRQLAPSEGKLASFRADNACD
jgi:hypothetical protein